MRQLCRTRFSLLSAALLLFAASSCTGDSSAGPNGLPRLTGTYAAELISDFATDNAVDIRTVGTIRISSHRSDGQLAGTFLLTLIGDDAPAGVEAASGAVSGAVTESGVVELVLHAEGVDPRLEGTLNAAALPLTISGLWGEDAPGPLARLGEFTLTRN